MTVIKMRLSAIGLVAALALALPASSSAHVYNPKSTPITATGENHTFTAGEAIITCKKAEFKYTGPAETLEIINVTPAYKECKVLESTALVTVEKAQYEFGSPVAGTEPGEFSMTSSIVGETGAQIKVTATLSGEKCEVVFPAQILAGKTTKFINNSLNTGAEVKAKSEGLEYKSNNKCLGFVGKEGKTGKYEGNATELGLIVE